jgi:flagellar hook-basal body complex protein FliE
MLRAILLTLLLAIPVLADDKQKAVELSRKGDYQASEALMVKVKDQNPEYLFYRMVNNYALNNKKEAEKYADNIIYSFGHDDIPIRYKDMALIIKYDMSTWKNDADDLGDISREMSKAADRLKNQKGGPDTQKIQRDVEKRLKAMIDKIEDGQKKAEAAAAAAAQKKEQERAETKPAQDTIKGQEQGTGQVDRKRVKEIAEVWGKLPEKERARAMVELTRGMPAKDRAVIENYFKELAKRSSKR